MLPLRARVDLGTMAMKEYFAIPKASTLLSYQDTRVGGGFTKRNSLTFSDEDELTNR